MYGLLQRLLLLLLLLETSLTRYRCLAWTMTFVGSTPATRCSRSRTRLVETSGADGGACRVYLHHKLLEVAYMWYRMLMWKPLVGPTTRAAARDSV